MDNIDIAIIECEPQSGTNIMEVIKDCIALARLHNTFVSTKFNGKQFTVNKNSNVNDVMNSFFTASK